MKKILLISIIMVLLLLAIAGILCLNYVDKSYRYGVTKGVLETLGNSIISYHLENGQFPHDFNVFLREKGFNDTDRWGNRFNCTFKSNEFVLISYGSDGAQGGRDYATDLVFEWQIGEKEGTLTCCKDVLP
jgi:type II secretory pathway pseudopilin PulG